jgi:hypothetical protein
MACRLKYSLGLLGICSACKTRFSAPLTSFPRRTPVRDLHTAFSLTYVYDYITKLCRQQAEVIQNHENANVDNIGQGEPRHRKCEWHKLGGGQVYDCRAYVVTVMMSEFRGRRDTFWQAERPSVFQDGLGSINLDLVIFQVTHVATIIQSLFYMESR